MTEFSFDANIQKAAAEAGKWSDAVFYKTPEARAMRDEQRRLDKLGVRHGHSEPSESCAAMCMLATNPDRRS